MNYSHGTLLMRPSSCFPPVDHHDCVSILYKFEVSAGAKSLSEFMMLLLMSEENFC